MTSRIGAGALLLLAGLMSAQLAFAGEDAGRLKYRAFDTPVNYNYGQVFVGQSSPDGVDTDALLVNGGGEGMLNEDWILSMFYSSSRIDEVIYSSTSNAFSVGVGYRMPLGGRADLVAGGSMIYGWSRRDSVFAGQDASDSDFGYGLETSLRFGFSRHFEGLLGLGYVSLYDATATSWSGTLTYYFTDSFGIGGGYAQSSGDTDSTSYGGYIRFNFE